MKYLLTAVLFFVALNSQSQISFEAKHISSGIGMSGTVKLELKNYPDPFYYSIDTYLWGTETIISTTLSDTLGLINQTSSIGGFAIDTSTGDTIARMRLGTPQYPTNLDWNNVQNAFTDVSCDGIIDIDILETVGTIIEIDYTDLLGNTTTTPVADLIDTNLCPGTYTLRFFDLGSPEFGYSTQFIIGHISTASANNPTYLVNVYSTISSDTACTATSTALVAGITGPYQYSWDGGAFTSVDSMENVCEGIHIITVVDNLNDTLSDYFIVSEDSNSIVIPIPLSGIIIDTGIIDFSNCSIDYTIPIDSSFISYSEIINANTLYIEGEFWQGGTMTMVADTIYTSATITSGAGYILITISMYCLVKADESHVFKLYDYVRIGNAGVNEEEAPELLIYPNPTSDKFTIRLTKTENSSIKIFDLNGKLVHLEEITSLESQIDISSLTSGVYLVHIYENDQFINSQKLIKQQF